MRAKEFHHACERRTHSPGLLESAFETFEHHREIMLKGTKLCQFGVVAVPSPLLDDFPLPGNELHGLGNARRGLLQATKLVPFGVGPRPGNKLHDARLKLGPVGVV